jgi:ribonuclease III
MRFVRKLVPFLGKKKVPSQDQIQGKKLLHFQSRIGYEFKKPILLTEALTHPSFNEHKSKMPDNQRLEFLGDSILGAILAEELFHLFPEGDEGILSRNRAVLARGSFLAELARSIDLGSVLRMSSSERKNRGNQRSSALEDAIEALIGAIFLDGGMEAARDRVLCWIGDMSKLLEQTQVKFNPKGQLQELVQANRPQDKIRYKLVRESGPPHLRKFSIKVTIGEEEFGQGEGKSKKEAEEAAAKVALEALGQRGEVRPDSESGSA